MPSKLLLCPKNAIDSMSLTVSPAAVSTLPVNNLKVSSRGRVWRSTTAAEQTISFTGNGAGFYMNFLSLYRHNLESNARWYARLYPQADWTGTPVYDNSWVQLLQYSEQMNTAPWSTSETTVTANAANDPVTGELTIDKIIPSTNNTTHYHQQNQSKAASAITYTAQFYIKAAGYNFARFALTDGGANAGYVDLNLTTGAATYTNSGFTSTSGTVTSAGDGGWYVTLTTTSTTATTIQFLTYVCNTLGNVTFAGDGTSGILLGRTMLETGSVAHDYTYSASAPSGVRSGPLCYDADTLGELDWGVDPLNNSAAIYLPQPRFSYLYFTRCLALSGTLTLIDTGNSSVYLEASRLFAGDAVELTYNMSSLDIGWKQDATMTRSGGGSLRTDAGGQYREANVSVQWVHADQRATIQDVLRYAGQQRDVFMSAFPGETGEKHRDGFIIGKLIEQTEMQISGRMPIDTWSTRFKVGEL